jgi:hypothetical protein
LSEGNTLVVQRIPPWIICLVVWLAVWLAVGEALYRGAGWDRTLSGFIGIAVASAVAGLSERSVRRARDRSSADEPSLESRP